MKKILMLAALLALAAVSVCAQTNSEVNNLKVDGVATVGNLNSIFFVDGSKFAKNDTGIAAATTACSAAGGGVVYLTDATTGAYSTLTTTITVPTNCELFVGYMGNGSVGLASTASPMINLSGASASLIGINKYGASTITGQGAAANVVNIAANCNGCKIEGLKIAGSGTSADTIEIQDNQRNLRIVNVTLNPIGECIKYVPGGSGFNVIQIEGSRCDGWTGSGMDFRLTGFANGTNLTFTGTYLANGLTSPVSYDLSGVQASFTNTAEDHNVANAIGIRVGTNASNRGCVELRNVQVEGTSLASQTGIQITGTGCVVIISPYINTDGTPISVQSAGVDTTIINPETSATANANSITYSAASTGHHTLIGENKLDKAISVAAGAVVDEIAQTYESFNGPIGINIGNGASAVTIFETNPSSATGDTLWGLDRGGAGTLKWRVGNEGVAQHVCNLSAQDDFCNRSAGSGQAYGFSTDGSANRGVVILANNGGIGMQQAAGVSLLIGKTVPTIAAGGCGGAAASIPNNNGTAAFEVNVGTTPTSGGCTVTMPAAAHNWACDASDITTNSTSVFYQKQTGGSTTSVVLQNFSDVAVATAPTASDVYRVTCMAY